jgi:hypothetical protein
MPSRTRSKNFAVTVLPVTGGQARKQLLASFERMLGSDERIATRDGLRRRQAAVCQMATAPAYGADNDDKGGDMDTSKDAAQKPTPLQDLLLEHIAEEPKDRMDLAMTLIYHLWQYCHGLADAATTADPWGLYDFMLVELVQGIVPGLEMKDRAFVKLFLELPRLTPRVFKVGDVAACLHAYMLHGCASVGAAHGMHRW